MGLLFPETGKRSIIILTEKGAEKATFVRLIKNAQMQGARNPEEYKTLGRSCGKVFIRRRTKRLIEGNPPWRTDERFSAAC